MSINGLVLGGGGSRGAFQIGVIMALHELGFKYNIVTGTSVGALNAFLLGTNKFDLLKEIWMDMDFDKIFDHKYTFKNKTLETFFKGLFKGGISLAPLENLIIKHVNVDELKTSDIKTGIVYTSPYRKYTPIKIQEASKEMIIDYLISSCSPAPFTKKKKINGKKCYDGGYCDNLPVKLAVDMSANKIIAIDISIGARKKVNINNIDYLCIKPCSRLPFVMNFTNTGIRKMIKQGYEETMNNRDKIVNFINR